MPGRDGTGPVGMGPMGGHGAGFCGRHVNPGYMMFGRYGCHNFYSIPHHHRGFFYQYKEADEKKWLEARAEILQRHLDAINKRLKELEGRDKGDNSDKNGE